MQSFTATQNPSQKTKSKVIFTLSIRRATHAFSKEPFLTQNETFLVSPIHSIEEFIETVAEVKLINNLETIFRFYEVQQEQSNPIILSSIIIIKSKSIEIFS